MKIKLDIEDNILIFKLHNKILSSYSYDQLIDCDLRFKAFLSIEDIHFFFLSIIEKEEIEIKDNKISLSKEWNINIPILHHQSFYNNIINKLKLECSQSPSSGLSLTKTIHYDKFIESLCLLKDGRLLSGGWNRIIIYNKDSFQPDFIIEDIFVIFSVYVLNNGNLASGGRDKSIRIYEINGNDYKQIHTLDGHTNTVYKIIELKDGRLCSCSEDKTIRIWDKNYQLIKTINGHTNYVVTITEMNDSIISVGNFKDNTLRIWNKQTYECIKVIQDVYCRNNNCISKLGENTIIVGGDGALFTLDILSFKSESFEDKALIDIGSILVLFRDVILIGNYLGNIICYDSILNQIIFTQSVHNIGVSCIIESEDKKIISSSLDGSINIYDLQIP